VLQVALKPKCPLPPRGSAAGARIIAGLELWLGSVKSDLAGEYEGPSFDAALPSDHIPLGVVRLPRLRLGNLVLALRSQNSFGPGRSCLAVQVIRVAVAIMRAIPTMLTAACIAMVLENLTRMT
jgi:hypothetical protein